MEAIADGDRDSAVALIDDGADVDRVVLGDGTPLIVAARTGDVPLVNLLLERGAQVDIPVRGDGSPLIAASTLGNLEIVTTLVERGADVNGFVLGDETPLINAARAGKLDVVALSRRQRRRRQSRGARGGTVLRAEIRSPLGEALKHEHPRGRGLPALAGRAALDARELSHARRCSPADGELAPRSGRRHRRRRCRRASHSRVSSRMQG